MAWHKIDQARVKMRAPFMEELDQVVMESNHTECVGIYEKMKALADEVGDNLRKAYNG